MILITYVLAILIFGSMLVWMVTFVYTSFRGSPYVPIKSERMDSISKYIKKDDRVADLGAGDGRILIEAIKHGASLAEGWELDAGVYALGKAKINQAKKQGVDVSKIKLHFGDFWNADVSKFNVIYVYQMTKYMKPMKEKIISQLKPGTLVVSPDYEIPEMRYDKFVKDKGRGFYVYKIS